ncbi:MAG: 1,2-phenylacetyl-CoA epoxidase subunit PaaD [Pseudomonadota bacterium]
MPAALKTPEPLSVEDAWKIVERLPDPEIPVLSLTDLGVIRHLERDGDRLVVGIAPTYSGCPATEVISDSVKKALLRAGARDVRIEQVLSPPWSTDWISDEGREKLRDYGIAPPPTASSSKRALTGAEPVACPRCRSTQSIRVSEFGSTPCKASYKCGDCLEPFEYFKCL